MEKFAALDVSLEKTPLKRSGRPLAFRKRSLGPAEPFRYR